MSTVIKMCSPLWKMHGGTYFVTTQISAKMMHPMYGSFYQHVLRALIEANIWWNADLVLQAELTTERYATYNLRW